ncbi:MAG TPA: hypothetical protein VIV07_03585, partial [Sphingomicrobium sp.]
QDDDRLSSGARVALLVFGAVLIAAAWPVGFLAAVIAGGGHSSPFGHSPAEAVLGTAMLAVAVLMIALGTACLAATNLRRLRIAGLVGLLFPLDFLVIAGAIWYVNHPPPPVYIPASDANAVISGRTVMAVPTCTPTHACTTRPPSSLPPQTGSR